MTATATPGHTAGHIAFMLSSQGRQACIVGDMLHHPLFVVERPCVEFTYDRDPRQAMRTRVQMLEMCANDRGFGRESRCASLPTPARPPSVALAALLPPWARQRRSSPACHPPAQRLQRIIAAPARATKKLLTTA